MIRLVVPEVGDDEVRAIKEVIDSGKLVQGEKVAEFENIVAEYIGANYAVAVNSGTSALHLSLLSLGIGEGDEVITSDFTFPATANVIELVGAKPVFIDIDINTYNIDIGQIEGKINNKTRAILPVHLFGLMADMAPILNLAMKYNLNVIEDAACALGAACVIKGKPKYAGSAGDIGCFSFHPRKNITTGEGGMVVTQNSKLAQRLRELRNHGMVSRQGKIDFTSIGFNNRMTEIQAAIGIVQMSKLNTITDRKTKLAQIYNQKFRDAEWLTIPQKPDNFKHIYQSYVVLISGEVNRDRLINKLKEKGIEANIGTYALHMLDYDRKKYGFSDNDFLNAKIAFEQSLALPLYPRMSGDDVRFVARTILDTGRRD